jgi:hypothetical protein
MRARQVAQSRPDRHLVIDIIINCLVKRSSRKVPATLAGIVVVSFALAKVELLGIAARPSFVPEDYR